MRWKVKPDPEQHDLRLTRKFMWSPTKFGLEMCWLEFVYSVYIFEVDHRYKTDGWYLHEENVNRKDFQKIKDRVTIENIK